LHIQVEKRTSPQIGTNCTSHQFAIHLPCRHADASRP